MKTIKVTLFVEGVAACCIVRPCECDERDRKYRVLPGLKKLTPDRKALLKVTAINAHRTNPPSLSLLVSEQHNE